MSYSIGEAAKIIGVSASTLRYYDNEGLLPYIGRSTGGIRVFSEAQIDALKIIECLKMSGLSIKEIKKFMEWCKLGDASLNERRKMFYERKAAVERQMEEIQNTLDTLNYKCWYYDTACRAGSEQAPQNIPLSEMPEQIRLYKESCEKQN